MDSNEKNAEMDEESFPDSDQDSNTQAVR